MSEKDYIKQEFQNRFSDFEAEVDPKVWDSIQSKVLTSPAPKNSFLSFTSLSIVASVSVLSVIGYLAIENNADTKTSNKVEVIQNNNNVESSESNHVVTEPVSLETQTQSGKQNIDNKESVVFKEENNSIQTNHKDDSDFKSKHQTVSNEKPTKSVIETEEINTQKIISNAPKTINVAEQSKVIASPMGGNAPLTVEFSSLSNAKEIKWIFDDGNESTEIAPVHTYEEPGVYFVTMLVQLENGSVVMDKAVIEVGEDKTITQSLPVESTEILVPNIFTPNSDGENDELILSVSGVSTFTISIYSASGKMVYNSENFLENWNGTNLTGERVEDGAYYYLINAIGEDGNVYAPKGFISLRTR